RLLPLIERLRQGGDFHLFGDERLFQFFFLRHFRGKGFLGVFFQRAFGGLIFRGLCQRGLLRIGLLQLLDRESLFRFLFLRAFRGFFLGRLNDRGLIHYGRFLSLFEQFAVARLFRARQC